MKVCTYLINIDSELESGREGILENRSVFKPFDKMQRNERNGNLQLAPQRRQTG